MASKKVNPQALAQLAKQKTASAAEFRKAEEADKKRYAAKSKKPKEPVSPTTTVPNYDDPNYWLNLPTATTTTTTTVAPPTGTIPTTTIAPPITTPPTGVEGLSSRLNNTISQYEARLAGKYTPEQIEKIKTGETEKKKGFWGSVGSALVDVAMTPVDAATTGLKTLSWIGRVGVSTFEESGQFMRDKVLGKKDVYEATDYIPNHPQTGKPIAKVGDPVIRNDEELLRTPIDEKYVKQFKAAESAEEEEAILIAATKNLVDTKGRTSSGDWGEWARQIGTPEEFSDYGFGKIQEIQTGNKWIDYPVAFIGDVALDPSTYASLGTNIPAKIAVKSLAKAGDDILADIVPKVATMTAKELTDDAAKLVAIQTGEKVTAKSTQVMARALVAEATQLYADDLVKKGASAAEKTAAAKAIKTANNRYSAIAPRREVGATSRQALANGVAGLRDDALVVLADPSAPDIARASAQRFVDTITDEVISDIAIRGNAALRGNVGQVLSTPGGLRWKIGKRGVTLPGTKGLTDVAGGAISSARLKLSSTPYGKKLVEKTTRIGEGGLFGSEYIWNWRTGLRTGVDPLTGKVLTPKQVVTNLARLAEDQEYRALKKAASQTIKVGVDGVFRNRKYRPYLNTVHSLLENEAIDWTQQVTDIARVTGRTTDEVEFAFMIKDLQKEFEKILDELSYTLGGVKTAYRFPENWFPQALNDKTVQWLSKATAESKEALRALGLSGPPMPGQNIANSLYPGMRWFGHNLTDADIKGGVGRLNFLANNPANGVKAFKGEFFDTNAASAVEKYAKKFADDYAFLRRFVKEEFEITPGGWATGARQMRPAIATPALFSEAEQADTILTSFNIYQRAIPGTAGVPQLAMQLGVDNEAILNIKRGIDNLLAMTSPTGAPTMDWFRDNADLLRNIIDESVLRYKLNDWSRTTITDAKAAVVRQRQKAERMTRTSTNASYIDSVIEATFDLEVILDQIDVMLSSGLILGRDEIYDAVNSLSGDLFLDYQKLFTQNPNKVADMLDNLSPTTLRTLVNLTQDAYVKLDNLIVPDVMAQADVAKLYQNVRRLKDPKYANFASRWINNFNRFIKTWVTATPGFHSRNTLSNAFMMIAAGGDIRYMNEGLQLLGDWNDFISKKVAGVKYQKEIIDELLSVPDGGFATRVSPTNPKVQKIAKRLGATPDEVVEMRFEIDKAIYRLGAPRDDWRFLADIAGIYPKNFDVEVLIDDFVSNYPDLYKGRAKAAQLEAFRNTMLWTGAAGFGDVEEVFGAAIPSRIGITGKEVPVRSSLPGRAVSKASEIGGALPRVSRSVGGKIENYSRFMLTYSGIREGMTPEMAASVTSRYLIDYEDLSQLDEVAKQVFPFWMWMSRNLPVQLTNMTLNPRAYSVYYNFRKNFEDDEGNNSLIPSYLKQAGIFKLPFGENIYAKPDLGFPGVGSPSPLQEGLVNPRSLLTAIPGVNLAAALAGRELYSGRPLEGAGEIIPEVVQQVLPPLGVAGRYASGLGAAGRDLPGPQWAQEVLGIQGPRESGPRAQVIRSLASLLGIPLTTIGPDQENIGRFEQIERLLPFIEEIRRERGE